MHKLLLLTLLTLLVLSQPVYSQEFGDAFSIPSGEIPQVVSVDTAFRTASEYQLNIPDNVISMSMDANIYLAKYDSYVRVLVVDDNGNEHLLYQADFPLTDKMNLKGVCEETCFIESGIKPDKLVIEMSDGSGIYLNRINYLPEGSSIWNGYNPTTIKQSQVDFRINTLNQKGLSWTAGQTPVSNYFYHEKKDFFSGWFGTTCGFEFYSEGVFRFCEEFETEGAKQPYPDALFEWRNRHGENWMSPVKNQASCGSCWAFSTIGTIEGVTNLYYNQHLNPDLSEQDLVSCYASDGCDGGMPTSALTYIRNNGVVNESCFGYTAGDEVSYPPITLCTNKCNNGALWYVSGSRTLGEYDREIAIKHALVTKGPLSITGPIDYWNHAIVLVGYGYDAFGMHWIIKNSWGSGWNGDGYGKIVTSPYQMHTNTYIVEVQQVIPPAAETPQKLCVDKDLDGYCNWGIGPKPTVCSPDIPLTETGYDCCSSQCSVEGDMDDSNNTLTTLTNQTLFCGNFPLLQGGEDHEFGLYYHGDELACCGDESDEYDRGGLCCDSPTDEPSDGVCLNNPRIKIVSGFSYPPTEEQDEVLVFPFGADIYFKAIATTFGESEGTCIGCTYQWYKDGVIEMGETSTEYSTRLDDFGFYVIKIEVTDSEGRINEKSVIVWNGYLHLTNETMNEDNPIIDGNRIVWQDYRNGNWNIYMHDLSTDTATQIYPSTSNQYVPDIEGDIITWIEYVDLYQQVMMYNLSSGVKTQLTTASAAKYQTRIDEGKIIWHDNRNGNWDIYMYDIDADMEIQVTTDPGNQQFPDIYENTVVYIDNRNGNIDIYYTNLSTMTETRVTTNTANQNNPAVYGNRIVWQDNRAGSWAVYMYDISTGVETKLSPPTIADQSVPAIYGDIVVWVNELNFDYNLDLYNISTGTSTPITAVQDGLQNRPRIDGNKIVWRDKRSGNDDIYLAQFLPEPQADYDLNEDGNVDIIDIVLTVFWQGKNSGQGDWYNFDHLDVNHDYMINFADVLSVINNLI